MATIITAKAQIVGNCYYYPVNVLPTPIKRQQTVYLENENCIYLFGGVNEVSGSHIVYKWNLSSATDGLIQIATTPQNKNFFSYVDSVVSIGNIAYFVGMHDGSGDSGLIYMFDMQQESWIDNSNLETLPIGSTYGCVSTNLSHIFMIGGYNGGPGTLRTSYHNYLQIYDVQSNVWISLSISFISEWSDQYCSMVDNTLFVFGGYTWNGNYNNMWPTNIMYKWVWNEWKSLGTKERSSRSGTTAYYNNIIYIIGGGYGTDCDVIEIFTVSSESITNRYRMLDPLWYLSSVVVDGSIYIIGGAGSNDFMSQKIQICDLTLTATSEPTLYPTIYPTSEPTYNPTTNPTLSLPISKSVHPTIVPISKSDDVDTIFDFTQVTQATFTQIIIGTCIIIACCCCPLLIGVGICFIYCHRSHNKPRESSVVNVKVSNSNNVKNEVLKQPGPLPGLSDQDSLNIIELINLPSQHTLNIEGLVKEKNQLTAPDSMDKKILNNALNEALDDEKKINLNIIDSEMSDGMYAQIPETNNNKIENHEKILMQPIDSMLSDGLYHQFETKNGDIIQKSNDNAITTKDIGAV